MICVDYAEIESKYVGETSKNLTRLFQLAEKEGAVIFFDEADALLSKRVTNMTSATDVSVNQTRSVLLNLLNQYQGIIIFATNFIQNFDPAFLRRIKYHVQFHLPDEALREQLWKMYIPQKMPCEVDCNALAKQYYFPEGFLRRFEELLIREGAATKAEFSQACKEAGLSAGIREKDDVVAAFILNDMASRQKAKKVELTELGECLYVSQKQRKDSKMTREEITLD